MTGNLRVFTPVAEEELDQVRALMRAFLDWHRGRHSDDLHLIDRYFDAHTFDLEVASLPGRYAAPDGALLLATYDGQPAGCVALRRIDEDSCEMKRMFVYPAFHGKGIGRALAQDVIGIARELGYRSMVLDTSVRQAEAQTLYRRLGFTVVPPHYDLPEDVRDWLVFMQLAL